MRRLRQRVSPVWLFVTFDANIKALDSQRQTCRGPQASGQLVDLSEDDETVTIDGMAGAVFRCNQSCLDVVLAMFRQLVAGFARVESKVDTVALYAVTKSRWIQRPSS